MKQWEIVTWKFPEGAHPAVIVSHPERCAHKEQLNVLLCSTQRAQRQARPWEVILDRADGLDWPTLCRCDLLYMVFKTDLAGHRGEVSPARRQQIVSTVIRSMGWWS
jgi:mRNA-degrading endonuclease toxin of MazEF toxin-antitoxin module